MVALRLKELPTLFNRSFHNRLVIFREEYVGPVRLEELLVDVKAGAKGSQSRLQSLHRIFLFRAVQAFVVYAGDTENHADIDRPW